MESLFAMLCGYFDLGLRMTDWPVVKLWHIQVVIVYEYQEYQFGHHFLFTLFSCRASKHLY